MSEDKKLDMDQLEQVAGGNAIDAINQAVSEVKPKPGDSLNAPYGSLPISGPEGNPAIINTNIQGPFRKDF